MNLTPDIKLQTSLRRWSGYLCVTVFVIGLAVLIGWQFEIDFLKRPLPARVAMYPMTAFAFLMVAIALLVFSDPASSRTRKAIAHLLSILVIFIGAAKIMALAFSLDMRIDFLLYKDKIFQTITAGQPNGMAPNTAMCFVITGTALLLLNFETAGRKRMPSHLLALLLGMFGMLSVLGYLYRVEAFYSVLKFVSMAIHTAICFLLTATAVLFANPGKGIMKEFTSTFSGSITARLLIPAAIIIPAVLGLLRLHGNWMGLYSNEFGVAIFALSVIVFFLGLIWFNSVLLNKRDHEKKLTEEALQQSRTEVNYLAGLVDKVNDTIVSFDQHFIIRSWNRGAQEMFGYSPDEVMGKGSREVLKVDRSMEELESFRRTAIKEGHWSNELVMHRKNGEKFTTLTSTTQLKNETGDITGYISIIKDFSERKKSEERTLYLARLIEQINDAVISYDANFVIKSWNPGAEEIFGFSVEEVLNRHSDEVLKIDYSSAQLEEFRSEVLESGSWSRELAMLRKNGDKFIALVTTAHLKNEQGIVTGYIVIIKDFSERKKAEERIAYLARLVEDTGDAVFSTDTSFHLKSWNRQCEIFYGYKAEEVLGKLLIDVIRTQLSAEQLAQARYELKTKGSWKGDVVHLKKDGTPIVVLVSNSVTRNERGEIDGYISVCRDISERKYLEEQLKKTNSELEAFTYSVSHDLRAPLRGIIGFTTILEEDYASKLDEEAQRVTGIIKANTMKMGRLIDDLLNFSRMGRHELVKLEIDTMDMVQGIVKEQNSSDLVVKNIDWTIHPLPKIKGDINTMRQVWINLISNAVKYSHTQEDPAIEIGSYHKNGQVVFYVKDNGVGFDQQYADKLFKVFQRLHSVHEFEGTGVGLAIVEKIISRHNGSVWAEAERGKGATFFFSIPLPSELVVTDLKQNLQLKN